MYRRRFIFVLLGASAIMSNVQADWTSTFTNGNFSSPLYVGWTNYSCTEIVLDRAVLQESSTDSTFLEQYFIMSSEVSRMSFQYYAAFDNGPSDTFSVSLLDSSRNPLINSNPNPLDPTESYFFMHDSSSGLFMNNAFVSTRSLSSGWRQVDFDLSSLAGTSYNAILAFDLIGNFSGPFDSHILLDDISFQDHTIIVPAPGALLLAFMGLVSTGTFKRIRK